MAHTQAYASRAVRDTHMQGQDARTVVMPCIAPTEVHACMHGAHGCVENAMYGQGLCRHACTEGLSCRVVPRTCAHEYGNACPPLGGMRVGMHGSAWTCHQVRRMAKISACMHRQNKQTHACMERTDVFRPRHL
eukprot:365772-Chlamydomonas_euryale.AAC.2